MLICLSTDSNINLEGSESTDISIIDIDMVRSLISHYLLQSEF